MPKSKNRPITLPEKYYQLTKSNPQPKKELNRAFIILVMIHLDYYFKDFH